MIYHITLWCYGFNDTGLCKQMLQNAHNLHRVLFVEYIANNADESRVDKNDCVLFTKLDQNSSIFFSPIFFLSQIKMSSYQV